MTNRNILAILVIIFLTACAVVSPAATPTVLPSPPTREPAIPPTPIPPTATPEPSATPTPTLSPTATIIPTFPAMLPAKLPSGPGAEWRLLIISESTGWDLGKAFASRIEQDTGLKVTLNDYAIGNLSASDVLDSLQSDPSPLLDMISKADVILLFPGPLGSLHGDTFLNLYKCLGNDPGTPGAYTAHGFDGYTADLEAIWAKILAARSGRPTILRALDDANPFVSRWNRDQIFSTCTTYWEAGSEAARAAAEHYSIPFLSRYDAYNGKDHTIDPGLGGYIGGDGIHPSKLAQQHTADLLAQMGYEAVMPP